jgi:hypothetical protein
MCHEDYVSRTSGKFNICERLIYTTKLDYTKIYCHLYRVINLVSAGSTQRSMMMSISRY